MFEMRAFGCEREDPELCFEAPQKSHPVCAQCVLWNMHRNIGIRTVCLKLTDAGMGWHLSMKTNLSRVTGANIC